MRSRTKVLDATLALITRDGFDAVSIAGVAKAAGVSRQTVYSIFGSREDLVSQAVASAALGGLDDVLTRLDGTGSPCEYLVELLVAGRAAVRGNPVLSALHRSGREHPFFDTGMVSRAKPVVRQLLAPMSEKYPETVPEIDDIADIALVLGLSVVLFDDPEMHSDDELRRFLTRWLGPSMPKP
ncbi:TetR family transcriptional regulator [Rhodococcus sp. SMB37]|uniref:TetR/AcrR family transcriptional regulator n=1 Tax=Rhodococcus sp. SMB37 TaxID=2512213 RepID=UPI0006D190C3|nr:TetR/AcrR family transcriptional regulator [Rhodococcus sp. SMB37]TCN51218.1 TetR family transcriptional regulator [Rhodococcus sp. SMB37]